MTANDTTSTDDRHGHPTPAQYVEIASILGGLTGIEVLLYVFRDKLDQVVTIPALLVLTVIKFSLVGLWFMHLRFDHHILRRIFLFGIVLAAAVFAVVAADWYLGANSDSYTGGF